MVILEDRDTHFKLITAYNVLPCKVKAYEKDYKKMDKQKRGCGYVHPRYITEILIL